MKCKCSRSIAEVSQSTVVGSLAYVSMVKSYDYVAAYLRWLQVHTMYVHVATRRYLRHGGNARGINIYTEEQIDCTIPYKNKCILEAPYCSPLLSLLFRDGKSESEILEGVGPMKGKGWN